MSNGGRSVGVFIPDPGKSEYVSFSEGGDSPGQLGDHEVQHGTDSLSSSQVIRPHITTISHSKKEFQVPFGEKHPKFTLVLKVLAIALVFFGIPGLGMGVGIHFGAIEAIKNTVWLNTTVSVGGTAYILVGGVLSGGLEYLSIKQYKEAPPDYLE